MTPSFLLYIDCIKVKMEADAQLTVNYSKEELTGRMVLCVVNFPPRQIGPAVSEVLTLGVPDVNGECVLIVPDREVPPGGRLY